MKILHVTKKYPNALGGDTVVVSNLEKWQNSHGHETVIVTSNCDEIKDGNKIYKFGLIDTSTNLDAITFRRIASLLLLFFKMFKILKTERPDIIHTHAVDLAFVTSFAARLYRIPIVHTFHIVTFYDDNQSIIRRKTELFLARGATPVIITAPNSYDVKKLRQAGLVQTIELPNGIDLNYWHNDLHIKTDKPFTFVAVGRLEEQKGFEYLIKATVIVSTAIKTNFRVMIVGEGSLEQKLRRLARKSGVEDYVELTGRKSKEEVRRIYESANAALLPALYETTPLTLLESWAMKLPTIATQVGILRDSKLGKLVCLVKIRDESSLADAMLDIMRNSKARDQLVVSASRNIEQFSWARISEITEGIYLRVLNEH